MDIQLAEATATTSAGTCRACGAPTDQSVLFCNSCMGVLKTNDSNAMREILDCVDFPLLLSDTKNIVVAANREFEKQMKMKMSYMQGKTSGLALECAHCFKPGGCRGTVHCHSCDFCATVKSMQKESSNQYKQKAELQQSSMGDPQIMSCTLSAEYLEDRVLLHLEDVEIRDP
jgi:hypothetical protein